MTWTGFVLIINRKSGGAMYDLYHSEQEATDALRDLVKQVQATALAGNSICVTKSGRVALQGAEFASATVVEAGQPQADAGEGKSK